MRFASSGWTEEEERPLSTSEIQRELFNVTLAFSENLDGWQKVGCDSAFFLLEDDFLLLGGQVAIEDSKHVTFPTGPLQEARDVPELLPGARRVQGFARHIAQYIFGLFAIDLVVWRMIASVRKNFM